MRLSPRIGERIREEGIARVLGIVILPPWGHWVGPGASGPVPASMRPLIDTGYHMAIQGPRRTIFITPEDFLASWPNLDFGSAHWTEHGKIAGLELPAGYEWDYERLRPRPLAPGGHVIETLAELQSLLPGKREERDEAQAGKGGTKKVPSLGGGAAHVDDDAVDDDGFGEGADDAPQGGKGGKTELSAADWQSALESGIHEDVLKSKHTKGK